MTEQSLTLFRAQVHRDRDDCGGGKRVIAKIPHARLGAVGDISGLAVFLASASARYMTGQLITVDGGHSIVGNWSSRP